MDTCGINFRVFLESFDQPGEREKSLGSDDDFL
jgi:hypothetical protein